MARYRFVGESPVSVPDLKRFGDSPILPGEEIETETPINNEFFVLVLEPKPKPQESEA